MGERLGQIIRRTCHEPGGLIERGAPTPDHVHLVRSLSDVLQRIKGRSSRRIGMEYPELRKRYRRRRFRARGSVSTSSGKVTGNNIMQ